MYQRIKGLNPFLVRLLPSNFWISNGLPQKVILMWLISPLLLRDGHRKNTIIENDNFLSVLSNEQHQLQQEGEEGEKKKKAANKALAVCVTVKPPSIGTRFLSAVFRHVRPPLVPSSSSHHMITRKSEKNERIFYRWEGREKLFEREINFYLFLNKEVIYYNTLKINLVNQKTWLVFLSKYCGVGC